MASSLLRGHGARFMQTFVKLSEKSTGGITSPSARSTAGVFTAGIQRRWYPICQVETNTAQHDISEDFLPELSKLISETLNKPEKNISISLQTGKQLIRDGNYEPTAVIHMWSIGVFDEQRNPGYSRVLMDYLAPRLGVPADRISIVFHPIEKIQAGHLLYAEQTQQ